MRASDGDEFLDGSKLEAIRKVRKILSQATEMCLGLLDVPDNISWRREFADSRSAFEHVLTIMGETLFKAATAFVAPMRDLDLYFWPGYDSVFAFRKSTRLTLLSPTDIPAGVGVCRRAGKTFPYWNNASCVAFKHLLSLADDDETDEIDGTAFTPGSTHLWLTQSRTLPALVHDAGQPLAVLCIKLTGAVKEGDGWFDIILDRTHIADWGNTIANKLNNTQQFRTTRLWPVGLPKPSKHFARFGPEPADERTNDTTQKLRQWLYSLWIAASLDKNLIHANDDWVLALIAESKKLALNHTERRLTAALSAIPECDDHRYACWYSLVLDETCRVVARDEGLPRQLGSAMILSSVPLPQEYFFIVKRWIELIYFNLRYYESAGINQRLGQLQQATRFAHQTVGLVTQVWADEGTRYLHENSLFSLWMLKELVTKIWGGGSFSPLTPATDGSNGFPKWYGREPQDILRFVVRAAVSHAVRRAEDSPSQSGDPYLKEVRKRACFFARMLSKDKEYDLITGKLGFQLPDAPYPSYVATTGFILAFYHSLWPAIYHALLATEDCELRGEFPPFLWLSFCTAHCDIYNAGIAVDVNARRTPHDREFFDLLERRLNKNDDTFSIEGPESLDNTTTAGIWRTRIVCLGGATHDPQRL